MKSVNGQDPSIEGVDTGDSFNFKCKYCHRNLSSRQNLKEHLYIHTGETPFKCLYPGCEKSFRQGSLLSIHKKSHKAEQRPTEIKLRTGRFVKLTDFPVVSKPFENTIIQSAFPEIKPLLENFGRVLQDFISRIQ